MNEQLKASGRDWVLPLDYNLNGYSVLSAGEVYTSAKVDKNRFYVISTSTGLDYVISKDEHDCIIESAYALKKAREYARFKSVTEMLNYLNDFYRPLLNGFKIDFQYCFREPHKLLLTKFPNVLSPAPSTHIYLIMIDMGEMPRNPSQLIYCVDRAVSLFIQAGY